jgi:hypothetical protein
MNTSPKLMFLRLDAGREIYAERFVRSMKEEYLDRIIPLREGPFCAPSPPVRDRKRLRDVSQSDGPVARGRPQVHEPKRQVCSNRMLLSGWCVRRCLPGE